MSIMNTWITLDEAGSKYGITHALILKWIEEGVVRCEMEGKMVARVNADDLELMLRERLENI